MVKPVINIDYISIVRTARIVAACAAFLLLPGCLGGTVAQQLVRTIAVSVADNAIGNASDADAFTEAEPSVVFEDRSSDELAWAIRSMRFKKATPHPPEQAKPTIDTATQTIKTSALVQVKVFNTVIGQERAQTFEQARLIGALNLPNPQEWQNWHVVTGEIIDSHTSITFISPPTLGKPISGSTSIVELADIGNVNIARYNNQQSKVYQAMDETSSMSNSISMEH